MPPDFRPLPPLGSRERTQLMERLGRALGAPRAGVGAQDPVALYDELSQLNYHDRITIMHQTFRHQRVPGFINPEFDDPETAVRMYMLNRLGRGTDGRPIYAGVNRFFHLMSDAPRDTAYQTRLRDEIDEVKRGLRPDQFADRNNEEFAAPLRVLTRFERTDNPYTTIRAIGITPGNPPIRTTPLREVDGPSYEALPALNSRAGRDLVAQLARQAGPVQNRDGEFIGFANPDAVFRTMARYDYPSRLALYRAVLTEQDQTAMAEYSEADLRRHLLSRFMYNSDRQMSFAGMDRYLRMVSDAPRDGVHTGFLRGEMERLIVDTNFRDFVDKDEPAIRGRYQRFFSIGGRNPDLLPNDPYMRMELAEIPLGRQPVLYAPPPAPAPVPVPAPAPSGSSALDPFRLDSLGTFPGRRTFRGLGDLFESPMLVGIRPLSPSDHKDTPRVAAPMSVVSL